jgi:hypothetical protein
MKISKYLPIYYSLYCLYSYVYSILREKRGVLINFQEKCHIKKRGGAVSLQLNWFVFFLT